MAKSKETELAVIPEQSKLNELIKSSDIELTKAEAHVKAFHPALAELGELSRPLATLDKENPTPEHALIARENRLKIVKVRTGSESIKDERKKILLIESNFIQSAFNLVKGACELTEAEYLAIEKHQERIEAERKAKLAESRKLLLEPFEVDTTYLPLSDMDEAVFNQLLADSKLLFETKKKQAEEAEKARIEAERLEAERLAEEKRLEAERIEAQRIENERLKEEAEKLRKEQELKDAEAKKEADRLAKIAADAKAESNRLAAELQAKKDAEELAYQKEKDRIEAEEADKKAKEKAALLAPDKEKIRKMYDALKAFDLPEVQSEEAKNIVARVKEGLTLLIKDIQLQSQKLV